MKTNPLKQRLKSGQPTFGTWLSLGDLMATRLLARMGFDWLTIDVEHSATDWSQVATLAAAIADAGCVPLVRVPEGNHRDIKRALDAGAWGIVVPMVDTIDHAKEILAAAKFPPEGNRSLGSFTAALNFDAAPQDYFSQANNEIVVVLQTESPQGIANAQEIYSLPGVDAIFVGPIDLRARLPRTNGQLASEADLEAAIDQVIATGRLTGTPTGMHVMDANTAKRRAGQGMQFIAVGSDVRFMSLEATATLQAIRSETNAPAKVSY